MDQAMNWLEKATQSNLIRAFCCDRASILFDPTRASKTLYTALAYPGEMLHSCAVARKVSESCSKGDGLLQTK
jgi:hypothetical protein